MKKKYLFNLILYMIPIGFLQAQFSPPSCLISAYDTQITIIGDSRSQIIATDPTSKYILNAGINNTQIIDRSHLNAIQNLGWGGSRATYKSHLLPNNGKDEGNWDYRIDECMGTYHAPYLTAEKAILQLGGNDILTFYQELENVSALYLLWEFRKNPVEAIYSYLTGKKNPKDEAFWLWHMEAHENKVVAGMYKVSNYFLSNQIPIVQKPHELLLMTAAPAFNSNIWFYDSGANFTWKKAVRLVTYFGRLQIKYATELYPTLFKRHGSRVHLLDMFYPYLHNVLYNQASYYVEAGQLADGIHFSGEGNAAWGKMLAFKMVNIGWFPINPELANLTVPGQDEKYKKMDMAINLRALEIGVNPELFFTVPLEIIKNPDGLILGYKKNFNGVYIYLKEGGDVAFSIGGYTLTGYLENGGAEGFLGFPVENSHAYNTFGERAFFECGFITHDNLDLINPGNYYIHGTEACPALTEEEKSAEPDFTGCAFGTPCGVSWFEQFAIQLKPTSGQAPFKFELVEGETAPGIIDKQGRIIGGPVNRSKYLWSFKVRMTDRDLRTVEKNVYVFSL
ncbi:MAG: hypothetical protein H7A25_23595 [Leptospiraceae bacterium]|nr:hypothetical protein [Leptospiraceae bacterium]MCP5502905.1 hypothetical protein [Leptospiraceae bacterium]